MRLDEYQTRASETAIYPMRGSASSLNYLAPAIAGEAGEVASEWAKTIRDDDGYVSERRRSNLKKELGDTLWMVAQTASELGYTLEEIAHDNLAKLRDRRERGVLSGSGNDR